MTLSMHRLSLVSGSLALLLTACPGDDVPADTTATETDGDGDGDTGDGDGDGDGDMGDGDGDMGDGDGDGDGDMGDGDGDMGDGDGDTGSTCGDGVVDDGEECDDGNTEDGDGCSSSCTVSSCGLTWAVTEDIPDSSVGAFDVAMGADGSIYAAGVTDGPDNEDIWVAKWNADGSVGWVYTADGGNGNDGANSVVLGADGQVYVAGWKAGAGDDIWYAELGADGNLVWEVDEDGPAMMVMDGDDYATGIDIDPNGDLVLSGRIRAGDGDDDVWVRKASATDGSEIWTSTWTGTGDGNFSTDRSGELSAAPDGTLWVAAREHIAFDTQDATLLHFDGEGNFVAAYQPQLGGSHQHNPIGVVASEGAVYFAFAKFDFPYRGWLYKLGTDGSEMWSKTEQDWIIVVDEETTIGEDWQVRGLGLDAEGNLGIAGTFANEEAGQNLDWNEAWVAKLEPAAGDLICRGKHQVGADEQIPPSLFIDAGSYNAAGFGLVGVETAGQGGATQLWTGMFLP